MAYKFSLGKYKHSGSLVSADSLTVSSGSVDLPSGTIQTHELQDSAVTNAKIAAAAVQSGSIDAGAVVNAHIADGTIENAKLANSGSTLGSTAVVLGQTVSTISGLTALSASAISGGVVVGDGAGMTNLSASQLNNFTDDVRSKISVSDTTELDFSYVSGAVSAEIKSGSIQNDKLANSTISGKALGTSLDQLSAAANGGLSAFTYDGSGAATISLSASVAGDGLGYSAGVLSIAGDGALKVATDGVYVSSSIAGQGLGFVSGSASDSVASLNVQTTGALNIVSDFVAIQSSLAGLGLSAVTGTGGVVSSLDVNRAGAVAILGGDAVAISSSIAGTGLSFATASTVAGAVTTLGVIYGSAAGTAVQGNTAWTASAGNGLTGDASGTLGAPVNFTFAVGAGNGIEVAVDSVAVKLSGGVGNQALVVNGDGLDLKQTIAGNRVFSDNVTINGGLTVAGTTTYVNTTNLEIADARILIASGSSAFTASHGFDFGGYAQLLTKDSVADVAGGNALSSSLPLLAPEVKANTFYGSLVGAAIESIQSVSANATGSASIILANANTAGFALELPAASTYTGKIIKVKKSDGTENAVTVQAAGADTIDGVSSIVLDSPYAAVMLAASGSSWFVF